MFQKRSLTTGFLVASLSIAAGLAVFASPNVASAGDKAVDCSKLKVASVKGACETNKGDFKKLRDAMKSAVDAANAAGEKVDGKKLDCKTCHENTTDYKLNGDGEKLFTAHLAKHFK